MFPGSVRAHNNLVIWRALATAVFFGQGTQHWITWRMWGVRRPAVDVAVLGNVVRSVARANVGVETDAMWRQRAADLAARAPSSVPCVRACVLACLLAGLLAFGGSGMVSRLH